MKNLFKKEQAYKWVLLVGYILLLAPFVYAVFYSMPANDDYALGTNWWGANIFVEACKRMAWNYMHWFGQSGVIAILIQVIFNPLYWFQNADHSFGIFMVIVFLVITIGTLIGIRRLVAMMSEKDNHVAHDVFTFLVSVIIFSCYYYNDVYNWWSGVPAYSLMMMFSVINCGNIVKYTQTKAKKDFIWMIVIGVITCSSLMNCVATGSFYLIYVFIRNWNDGDSFIKKAVPLFLYIISGIVTVAAPGNYDRMEYERYFGYDVKDPQFIHSGIVTIKRVVYRGVLTAANKPWILLIFLAIILLGIYLRPEKKPRLAILILSLVAVFASAFGAVYPYVLGSSKEFDSEFANRIYFVEDYIVFIGLAVIVLRFGQWIAIQFNVDLKLKRMAVSYIALLVLAVVGTKVNPYSTAFVPVDIVRRADLIRETYYFWDDILNEIENSEEADVKVYRKEIDWCPYVYNVGLANNGVSDWPIADDVFYCGCNQGVSRFFGKNSIELFLE